MLIPVWTSTVSPGAMLYVLLDYKSIPAAHLEPYVGTTAFGLTSLIFI